MIQRNSAGHRPSAGCSPSPPAAMLPSSTEQSESSAARALGPREPIAIVGLGCRLPGQVTDAASYWRLLDAGIDAITTTPATRWNTDKFFAAGGAKPGKTQSRWGGYVDDLDRFDPQFFGISPREANSMDPQQRLLLEVAFRALEDGGQPLQRVAGRPVSVFVGISSFDYAVAGLSFQDRGVIDAYSNTGGSSSIAANRISYCFDLRGPSVAVDTACSSSLVAVHMACESLWQGEAELALAGGVNALLLPDFYVAFSQLGVLSPDGRCKTFDARANGYVRSEGAGMVLLKPLSAALRDKDMIYAVVRATALNQDGRTPGMTVPSQAAQEALIRQACQRAGVLPAQIQYVEAHGTGTAVGDPLEAAALAAVLGENRSEHNPCWIGSVKTNIGHLEAGAGIASLIKVALALHHQRIPAHLHFQTPNPAIDFEALKLRVPRTTQNWEAAQGTRLAGINGFGYGGANAHVIMQQAPAPAATFAAAASPAPSTANGSSPQQSKLTPTPRVSAPVLLPLSGRSKAAVAQYAAELGDWLERDGRDYHLAEVAGYLAHRRSHLDCRATVCATSQAALISELRTLAASNFDEITDGLSPAELATGAVFVCSGQGPQWWAMGRSLLKYSPVFRSWINRCDAEFSKLAKWSLLEELSRDEANSRMQHTAIAQPSLFAIQVSLAALWESWGIRPTAVVGHSVGEIAAAYLTGALSWEDACLVAFHRGRTMDLASSQGAMLAAGLAAAEVPAWLEGIESEASLAASNGPSSVTISGTRRAIELLAQRLEQRGVFCRRLAVEYAFHSPQMEPVRGALLAALKDVRPQATHTTLISTVTGDRVAGTELDAEYWWKNVRHCVRFSDGMATLARLGYGLAVELGPHPVLAYAINECFQAAGKSVRSVPSLNRQQDDLQCISKSLGNLYALGCDIHWAGFYNQPLRKLPLPLYPFQQQRCWSESFASRQSRLAAAGHPLLGETRGGPQPGWQQRIDVRLQTYLADHVVRGAAVYPAAAVIESAIAAGRTSKPVAEVRLRRLRLHTPCILAAERPQWIETNLDAELQRLTLSHRDCQNADWSPLATVDLCPQPTGISSLVPDFEPHIEAIRTRCATSFTSRQLYDYCRQLGLQYGPAFRGTLSGLVCPGEALTEVELPAVCQPDEGTDDTYHVHPALLDSCFHAMIAADPNFDHLLDGLYLPSEIGEMVYFRAPSARVLVHARMKRKSHKSMCCDIDVFNLRGERCLAIRDFESRRVGGGQTAESSQDLLYAYEWLSRPLVAASPAEQTAPGRWLVFMDEGTVGRELCQRLRGQGHLVREIYREPTQVAHSDSDAFYQLAPTQRDELREVFQRESAVEDPPLRGLVYLWGLDVPNADELTPEALDGSLTLTSEAPLAIVQAWDELSASPTTELILVTHGAQSADAAPEQTRVAQAPLIGLGRVVISEYGKLHCKLVDLPHKLSAIDIDCLAQELDADDDEDEVQWRAGQRYAHRFVPQVQRRLTREAVQTLPSRLCPGATASIDELHYATQVQTELEAGEVEIEVLATGLNFSDVMKALDLYPGLPDGPVNLGAECSGRIARVPPGSSWQVGQEVIAVAPGAFGTHVVVNEALVARKPSRLSHEQAAALPIAFLTAEYALSHCAQLESGDSVLIHAASGGVGLAAVQLAQRAGLQVFATAGTKAKRQYLRDLGIGVVMDSRTLDFSKETLEATGGQGVDAVLNSLPGEAIPAGLSVLKTGGRFLEIGKRDIYADSALGLYPFRNNLAMFAIDLDQLFKQRPQRMGRLLRQLADRFEAGELEPLPTTGYPADETPAAFRYMQQAKHIGKVVVGYQPRPSDVRAGSFQPLRLQPQASYWIAGGLGGFGLEIARWLVARGARQLVLSGRSRTLQPDVQAAVDELTSQGATLHCWPADITRAEDVRQVLSTIDRDLPPLRGVIHAAMVLEDKLLVDLDRDTLRRVLLPKVIGGWNLHRETLGRELDLFVLFSSLSSIFGHAGQANYSAANAFLDSLAYYRRSQGLPGLVMNWGHLGEVGYLAQRQQLSQRLERQGVLSFTVEQATECLELALQSLAVQLSVLRIDWRIWRGLGITDRVSPRFADLLETPYESESSALHDTELDADGLRAVSSDRRVQLVDQLLRRKLATLLGTPADQIPSQRALLEMGLDSLMAVEIRNWIESQLQINLPIAVLMRSESLAQVAQTISELIQNSEETPAAEATRGDSAAAIDSVTADNAHSLLQELPNLDEEEVTRLLGQMLREQE